jgi:hypothetical protein
MDRAVDGDDRPVAFRGHHLGREVVHQPAVDQEPAFRGQGWCETWEDHARPDGLGQQALAV